MVFRSLLCGAVILGLALGEDANYINIVMLTTPSQAVHARGLEKTIEHSIGYLDTRVLGNSGFSLRVQKVEVPDSGVFSNDFLYGSQKYVLGNASFFLLPYHINKICVLGEMLKVPVMALNYQPGILCENVFSMRPDPVLMNQAVVTMIREDRPRVVAVVIEAGFSDFAMSVMSLDQQLNHFVFQIIALVNFNDTSAASRAVKELKESGTRKVFLVMQQENVYSFLKEVHAQNFKSLHAYRWFTPVLDTEKAYHLKPLEGMMSLSIPIDEEQLNKTIRELGRMRPSYQPSSKDLNPLVHDALTAIAYATREFRNQICDNQPVPRSASYCPIRRIERGCKSLEEYLSEVMFRGLTGDVKFTKSRYRNVTIMNANEVNRGRKNKLGIWSVPCEAFKWNLETTFAKQKGRLLECKKVDEEKKMTAFKPRKRNLRVVARIEKPFIFYDPLLKTDDPNKRFSGFCKDILDRLALDLDFKYEIYLVPDGKYGKGLSNNSAWNGMIGELVKKEADIAIGSLTMSSARESVVDFSKSFMDFTMALLLKKPTTHHVDYFVFFKPFTYGIWLSVFASMVAVGFFMFVIERFSPFGYRKLAHSSAEFQGDEFNLANSFWFVVASLLQQGPDQTPRSTAGRLLSASFWMFVTIITASYIASLVALFLGPNTYNPITSVEELTNQNAIGYGVLRDGHAQGFFESSTHPLYRKMHRQMIASNSFQTSVTSAVELVRKGGFAFLGDQPLLQYINEQQPCDTNIVKYLMRMKSYAFGLQLASEWTNPMSVQILHLRETGFIESLRMKWWNDQSECMEKRLPERQYTPLGFRNMAGIIAILAVGGCLSLLLLTLELKCKSWMKCLQSKQSSLPKAEQRVIKAPQITYLDYKANGESYDLAFSKLYGSKCNEMSSLDGSFDEHRQKIYKEAPESTL